MKKGIIVLLIAVLVSGFAFAKLSGNAGVIYDANLDDKSIGAFNVDSLNFSFTFASDEVKIDSSEDEIHVEVAASAKFILGELNPKAAEDWDNAIYIHSDYDGKRGIGAVISLDTAKIVGKNWYVDITGTQGAYDYAKAAVLQNKTKKVKDDFGNLKKYDNEAATYKVQFAQLGGVTVGYNDFTASLGFGYQKDLAFMVNATLETPEFAFSDDAVKVQAATEFCRARIGDKTANLGATMFGASAKATVAIQDITVGAAADFGLEYAGAEFGSLTETETNVNVDGRVDFKYNFVDVNLYTYAGKSGLESNDGEYQDFYLEAKAAFDLNAFELPLKVTVSAKNITNAEVELEGGKPKAGIVPAVKVEFAKDAITAAASFDINTEKKTWNALVYGSYAFEKFTAGAGLSLSGKDELNKIAFAAFAESDKLVKGATFGLGYGLKTATSDKFYGKGGAVAITDAGQYTANYKADTAELGHVAAFCKIAF